MQTHTCIPEILGKVRLGSSYYMPNSNRQDYVTTAQPNLVLVMIDPRISLMQALQAHTT